MIESGLLLVVIAGAPDPALAAQWSKKLDGVAKAIEAKTPVDFSFYASDEALGVQYGWDLETWRYLASVVKVPYMLELFRQREAGLVSFSERLRFGVDDIRDGAPRLGKVKLGTRLTLKDLLEFMVQFSDNAATDMIGRRLGIGSINEGLAAQGFEGFAPLTYLIDVRRGIYRQLSVTADDLTPEQVRAIRWTRIWDPQVRKLNQELGLARGAIDPAQLMTAYDRYYGLGVNHARVDAVCRIFERMSQGKLVNRKVSKEMLDLLYGSRTSRNRILGKLPRGTRVAHKTGSQFTRVCDFGVVELPNTRPLVLGGCSTADSPKDSEAALSTMSRAVYDLAVQAHRRPSH